jgi:hypothetical protein
MFVGIGSGYVSSSIPCGASRKSVQARLVGYKMSSVWVVDGGSRHLVVCTCMSLNVIGIDARFQTIQAKEAGLDSPQLCSLSPMARLS